MTGGKKNNTRSFWVWMDEWMDGWQIMCSIGDK